MNPTIIRPTGTGLVGRVITGPTCWPPTNVSCCGGRVYPPYHTQSIKGHGPIKNCFRRYWLYSTGLKSSSIFVIHQTNSVIAMLLKKSSAVYSQKNHNASREIRYSPILGALKYYAKINAAWSLVWSSHLSTAIKQADYVNEIHAKSSSISAVQSWVVHWGRKTTCSVLPYEKQKLNMFQGGGGEHRQCNAPLGQHDHHSDMDSQTPSLVRVPQSGIHQQMAIL